jgi:nickel-dependent lactate racemase
MQKFEVCSGPGRLRVEVPEGWPVEVAEPLKGAVSPEGGASLAEALARPHGSPRLSELARGAKRALLVHTDASRPCPDAELLAAAVQELEAAGVQGIRLLCALGAHRPPTLDERKQKLGALFERYPAFDHDCADAAQLADLGSGPFGVPLSVNRLAAEADLVVSTGIVEPHQYAGYSGGAKTLAIGAGGEATISATHSPAMIEREGCGPGLTAGNPFQAVVRESVRRVGSKNFILNVVRTGPGWACFAGSPLAAHEAAVRFCAALVEVPVSPPFNAALCGVPSPKSRSLYQATRAASYLALSPRPVLSPGATIILAATLEEGAGSGPGERRFLSQMESAAGNPQALLARLRSRPLLPGEQRAFIMAKVLAGYRVVVVGGQPALARRAGLESAASIEEALEGVASRLGRPPRLLILPDAMDVLPAPSIELR